MHISFRYFRCTTVDPVHQNEGSKDSTLHLATVYRCYAILTFYIYCGYTLYVTSQAFVLNLWLSLFNFVSLILQYWHYWKCSAPFHQIFSATSLMDAVKKLASRESRSRERKIYNLKFADDIDLLDSSYARLEKQVQKLDSESRRYGMQINRDKTMTMVFPQRGNGDLMER